MKCTFCCEPTVFCKIPFFVFSFLHFSPSSSSSSYCIIFAQKNGTHVQSIVSSGVLPCVAVDVVFSSLSKPFTLGNAWQTTVWEISTQQSRESERKGMKRTSPESISISSGVWLDSDWVCLYMFAFMVYLPEISISNGTNKAEDFNWKVNKRLLTSSMNIVHVLANWLTFFPRLFPMCHQSVPQKPSAKHKHI